MEIKFKDLKKGDNLKTVQLGAPVTSVLLESPKQGRGLKSVVLVDCHGTEVGMFDEVGSVYARDIVKVYRKEGWHPVVEHPEDGRDLTNDLFGE